MNEEKFVLPSLKEAQKRTNIKPNIEKELFEIPLEARNIGNGKKFYLRTYGCQANERDSETISGILHGLGFSSTEDVNDADFILFNTCAIRKNAEDKVIGELGHLKSLKRKNPELIFGVCGCMVQEEEVIKDVLKMHDHIDLVFGTHNIHRLPILLYQAMISKERTVEVFSKEGDIIENLPTKRFGEHKAWVNITYGCDKFCTYCIVPYTRGKERSRSIEDILKEIQELIDLGYKEVTLLGQNVNAYGKDLGEDVSFAKLLEATANLKIERIRFMTSHPWDFTDEMIDVIAKYDNIMNYIHLPVQSGSSKILKLMGRRYSKEEYLNLFDRIKTKIPDVAISSDIIVGFPNETEEEFNETMEIVNYCKFDNVFSFIYSAREGTPAAKMEDNVSFEEKQQRLYKLQEQINTHANKINSSYVGKTVKVLVDGPSKKNKDVFSGYTEHFKLVNFTGDNINTGDIVKVKITEHRSWTLRGEKVD